jgi:hypothetical protein
VFSGAASTATCTPNHNQPQSHTSGTRRTSPGLSVGAGMSGALARVEAGAATLWAWVRSWAGAKPMQRREGDIERIETS